MSVTIEQARAAKAKALAQFAGLGLAGVGIARQGESLCLKINLQKALPDGVRIPDSLDGVPIQVEITGKIRKFA